MAAPPHVTTKANSGRFLLNKALSDSSDEILRLQGVSWLKRRAISALPANFSIEHTTDEAGIEQLHMIQKLTENFRSTKSLILDGQEREEDDVAFGPVNGKYCRIPVEEIADEFLRRDWTQDTIDDGIVLTESWSTPGKSSYKWRAVQVWGFAMVNGERRYVKRITFTSSQKVRPVHVRIIFDYLGEN